VPFDYNALLGTGWVGGLQLLAYKVLENYQLSASYSTYMQYSVVVFKFKAKFAMYVFLNGGLFVTTLPTLG
jgi:hypothetical protein